MRDYAAPKKLDPRPGLLEKTPPVDARAGAPTRDVPVTALEQSANEGRLAELLGALQRSSGNLAARKMFEREGSLPAEVRGPIESALGEDLGGVRVHTGESAAAEAEARGAAAFTRGEEIWFGEGEYDPESEAGREQIAHEAAHVVQFRRTGSGAPESAVEREASQAAAAVGRGEPFHVRESVPQQAMRQKKEEGAAAKKEPEKPKEPPKAPVKPETAPLTYQLTAAILDAIRGIIHDMSEEDKLIEIFTAPAASQAALLMAAVMMMPAAAQEIGKQQPPGIEKTTFMRQFANFLWEETGGDLMKEAERRFQADQAFRKKVDRAKGKKETPAAEPKPAPKKA